VQRCFCIACGCADGRARERPPAVEARTMRLASYSDSAGPALGLVLDDQVYCLARLAEGAEGTAAGGAGLLSTLDSLLAAGEVGEQVARRVAKAAREGAISAGALAVARVGALGEVRLLAASPQARKVFALAGNYEEHVKESKRVKGFVDLRRRRAPRVFMKPPTTTLRASGDPIEIPPCGRQIDWEVELALVMGKRARRVAAEQARDCVFGYCLFNDVSERAFQIWEREESSEWDRFFDWLNGKWFDSFAPAGPYLVTKDEVPDPYAIELKLAVNGVTMQADSTANMIFDIETVVEFLSAFVTLEPGDIIAMGTPAGVGMARGVFLKPGDEVVAEGTGLGRLVNRVVAATD